MLILFADDAETLEREAENEDSEEADPRKVMAESEVSLEPSVA